MSDLFQNAEQEISEECGDFTLFGLFERIDIFGKYDVVVSAPWLKSNGASTNLIFDLVRASIGNDKWLTKIGLFMIVPDDGPFAAAVREALPDGSLRHGFKRITNFFYDGEVIRDAIIITSTASAGKKIDTKSRQPETAAA